MDIDLARIHLNTAPQKIMEKNKNKKIDNFDRCQLGL